MLNFRSLLGFGLCACLCVSACKPAHPPVVVTDANGNQVPQPAVPGEADEAAAKQVQNEANALAAKGQNDAAEAKRDALIKQYPATLASAEVLEIRAQAAAAAGKGPEAISFYEQLIYYRPNFERVNMARERYAALLVDAGRFDDGLRMFVALYKNARDPADQERLGMLLARMYDETGHGREALELYVDLSNQPQQPESRRQELRAKASNIVASNISFNDAETLWASHGNDASWAMFQPLLAYKLAKIYFHTRDYDRSEQMLNLVSSRFTDSPFAQQARDFLVLLKSRFEVNPHVVGVILPMSGRYKAFGDHALQGIQQGFANKAGLKLVVKDSQGEANIAAQAVESLVLENHVVAIIGPLLSNEAMAAAIKAEELSVPLLALSHRKGLAELGPYTFSTGLTVAAQARALAQVAFEQLAMSRFAVLYPKSPYGTEFMTAFWDEVDRRRGEIRGVEPYDPEQTTFREPVRRLVGRWYMNARQDYKDALDALKKQKLSPMRMRSELEKLDKTLPPLVDFDGLIIPDAGRQIGLIAPALAFEDMVLTHDPKILERIKKATARTEVHPVTLMGASTWNMPQTIESCEQYCEDAVFVDAYFPNSTDPKVRDFIATFREAGTGEPNLTDAQAFDTAGLLRTTLVLQKPTTRHALRDALEKLTPYNGITGKLTFDANGDVQRELFVLTIKDHAIRQYEAPAEPPRL